MQEIRKLWRGFRPWGAGRLGARSDPSAGASSRLLDALLRRRWWTWVLQNLRTAAHHGKLALPYPFRGGPPS